MYEVDDVVEIGKVIAVIATEASVTEQETTPKKETAIQQTNIKAQNLPDTEPASSKSNPELRPSTSKRFYSPLARSIAVQQNLSLTELESIPGTGINGRVKKSDILIYLKNRDTTSSATASANQSVSSISTSADQQSVTSNSNVEIIQMDRMRKMIAKHMVDSKRISPHVTSFVEVDMTNIVNWRNKNKKAFLEKYGTKITFTPIFIEAVTKAMKDFPAINASVDGDTIIIKKDINIGIAAALPSGNLIVPVIRNADHLNLPGIAKQVNTLVDKARNNKLKPDDISDGTYTISNVCLLYTSPSPRDKRQSRMPSSA